MKLGILSGTFDPVHQGHLWLARESMKEFELDKLILLPEKQPRNKEPHTSYEARIQMLKLAIRNDSGIEVLAMKEGSHSAKSVMELINSQYSNPEETALIIGADVFVNIANWDDWEQLKNEVSLIVSLRTEDDGELAVIEADKLGVEIDMLSSEYPQVSSSDLRKRIKKGDKLVGINRDVDEYIKANKLYGAK